MRYIFMGSPPIASNILQKLLDAKYPPLAVVTQPARPSGRGQKTTPTAVAKLARENSLDVYEVKDVNESIVLEKLTAYQPEIIFVVAFGQLLKKSLLDLPSLYCLNLHASLLPKYRGAAPVQYAIRNGDRTTGVSIQKMVKQLDAGDVFLQKEIAINPDETSGDLLKRLEALGAQAAIETFEKLKRKDYSFTPQNPDKVTYAPKIQREEANIDWARGAEEIRNQILALQPWPVAETSLEGVRLKVFGAEAKDADSPHSPGTLTTDRKTYLHAHCGDGRVLSLTEIQLENRKRLKIEDFLRGYSNPLTKLGAQ